MRPGVLPAYERIAFEKERVAPAGAPLAELVCPGHPLLEATIDLVLQDHRELLRRGAFLVDEADPSDALRALVYLEHAVVDGRPSRDGQPTVVSRRMEFVELTAAGTAGAGAAPYLDYRPASDAERALLAPEVEAAAWLAGSALEARAAGYAIERLSRSHLAEVRERTIDRVERTRREVHARLTYEINYWDAQAARLREQERAGRQTRLASGVARRRADDLADRLRARLRELDLEAAVQALPPVVVGGAIVVPRGLLDRLSGKPREMVDAQARETAAVEAAAMRAVMDAEHRAGREPEDVSAQKVGWDVQSRDPGGRLRFIEVKGRAEGATTVTVTRNEIAKSLNVPDRWYLAIVEVRDGRAAAEPVYLRRPFAVAADPAATSVNYSIRDLLEQGERVEAER